MKLSLLAVLLFAAIGLSCTSNEKSGNAVDSTLKGQVIKLLPAYFYKRLEGTIAGQKVTMNLNKVSEYSAGSYYYLDNGKFINLSIDTVINTDSLILNEYVVGEESSTDVKLELKWTGLGFSGRFKNKQGKYFPIHLKEHYPQGSYQFNTDSIHESKLANTANPHGPKANFAIQYLTCTGKNVAWLNNNLKTMYGITNGADWKPAVKQQIAAYFSDYAAQMKDEINNDPESETSYTLNHESISSTTVRYNENNFVVIELMNYAYSGGAHGNYASGFYNYDVANQRVLKLSDIVTIDSIALDNITESYFRKQYGLKANDPLTTILFDKKLKANDNFYINGKGISFLYNPYEIASYAQGQIDVFIPYKALLPYLNPNFKKRIGI